MTARQKAGEREPLALRDSVEEVWLAGLGALALAEEKGTQVFRTLKRRGERLEGRLVRRGTTTERTLERTIERRRDEIGKAGEARLREVRSQVEALTGDTVARVNRGVDDAVTRVLHRIGVPTAQEITALTKRVEALRTTLAKAEKKPAARNAPRKRRHAAARKAANRRLPVRAADTPRLPVPVEPVGADV
jgi:poly(hydroxyalkanoate) granule-associated protein